MPSNKNSQPPLRLSKSSAKTTILTLACILGGAIWITSSFSNPNDTEDTSTFDNKMQSAECTSINFRGEQTVAVDSISREYFLYVPQSYDCEQAPLVINFHGFGGNVDDFRQSIGDLESIADTSNFILAYPQGIERSKGAPEWDPGDNDSQSILDNDLVFVDNLILDISEKLNINQSKVYAAGYSNGGMMAYGLACQRSDTIAAIGVMSGVMLEDNNCNEGGITPVIHFHGTEDFVLPYLGGSDFAAVTEVIDFWVDRNGLDSNPVEIEDLSEGKVSKTSYGNPDSSTEVTLYEIKSEYEKPGGHVWFTQDIEEESPNQILWDFLGSY